jgi:hypothetical protein
MTMNMDQQFLTNGPEATHFLNMALHKTGAKALLGDPDNLDPLVRAEVQGAHMELNHAVGLVAALVKDATRTLPQKHEAAKVVAEKTVAKLQKVHDHLVRTLDQLESDAANSVEREWAARSDTAGIDSEIRSWMRSMTKEKDGLERIKHAVTTNEDAARTLWSSPSFLTGIPEKTTQELQSNALRALRPKLAAKIDSADAMTKVAEKFAATIKKIPGAFYNPLVADAAVKTRVEV